MRRSRRLIFSSFGVPLSISYPRNLEERVQAILPPARDRAPATMAPKRFVVQRYGKRLLRVTADDGEFIVESQDPGFVLDVLDASIRSHVASQAREHVFVHAGAVAVDGLALVLPGPGLAGKSTLVAALVGAGATYLSDEYAVLERDGRVTAYPRAISIRAPDIGLSTRFDPATDGRGAGGDPHPVGIVVLTEYRPGVAWHPERLTPGVGALRLFANTVTASTRPEDSLSAIRNAVGGAVILEGPRGEADDVAPLLIAELTALARSQRAQSSSSASR